MKTKLKAMMNRNLRVKDVLILMFLPIMAMAIGGAVVGIWASKVKYDNAYSKLVSTNVQAALDEIQMENPGITFRSDFDTYPAMIQRGENERLELYGGHESIVFTDMDTGAVQVKGNFEVLNPDTNKEVFSVNAKTGIIDLPLEDVISPVLQNGWTNLGGGWASASFWKDQFSVVHIRGMIEKGNTTPGTLIFNLPEGYRLTHGQHFTVGSGNYGGLVSINSNGNVIVDNANVWVDLSGIYFRTDQ